MKTKKYYAVYADNGFLCTDKWDMVLRMKQYFRSDRCKSYKSKEDAINATINGYNEIHDLQIYIGEIELNKPRFTKDFNEDEVL
jgi:hypothetical protein